MPKIPRIEQGPAPSVYEGTGHNAGAASPLSAIAGGLSVASDALEKIGAAQMKKAQEAREQKQKIIDEVETNSQLLKYDQDARARLEELKDLHFDSPDALEEVYLRETQDEADRLVGLFSESGNDRVALALAQQLPSRAEARLRDARDFIMDRKTQQAKDAVDSMLKMRAAGGQLSPSLPDLEDYIQQSSVELESSYLSVYGKEAAAKALGEFKSEATKAYFNERLKRDPIRVVEELNFAEGPAGYLTETERETLRGKADTAREGYAKVRRGRVLAEGASRNTDIVDAFLDGSFDAAFADAERRKNDAEKMAVKADPNLVDTERQELLRLIDARSEYIDLTEDLVLSQKTLDAARNPKRLAQVFREFEVVFGEGADESAQSDLAKVLSLQRTVLNAYNDKVMPTDTFKSMFKYIALALPKAEVEESDLAASWNWGLSAKPRKAGHDELSQMFRRGSEGDSLTESEQVEIRTMYIEKYNAAAEAALAAGRELTVDDTRKAARDAFTERTGIRLNAR